MRRLTALMLVATMATGCSAHTTSKAAAITGGVLMAASVVPLVAAARNDTNMALLYFAVGVPMLSVGTVALGGGLLGMHYSSQPSAAAAPTAEARAADCWTNAPLQSCLATDVANDDRQLSNR